MSTLGYNPLALQARVWAHWRYLAVDHIIAKARGGTDHISNLQLLCTACNSLKGRNTHEELLVLLTDKGWIKRKKAA